MCKPIENILSHHGGGYTMNAYRKIQFYTPGQLATYAAGIIATAAAMLAAVILC